MNESNPMLLRLGLLGFLIFCLSFIKSCSELQYYLGSKEATARVTKIYEETGRRSRHVGWHVSYEFRDEAASKTERGYLVVSDDELPLYTVGQKLDVEYRGSSPVFSRVKGENNMVWVYVFLGSLVFSVAIVAIMSLQGMKK